MGRGKAQGQARTVARVAVLVRAGAAPLWWLGLLAAAVGVLLPGPTGRRIGLLAGAALFLIVAAVVALARGRRFAHLSKSPVRAGRSDFLQDRAVTVRNWRRAHRWWLLAAFVVAVGSSFALPAAGGLALAGAGAGRWLKAVRLGRREHADDLLLWVRTDWIARGPAGKQVKGYRSTGVLAGDAAPGGARRR
ncbi:hypothetical protein OG709_13580 [Streptomyces sp. NBC_01267]|uniref:hypothetical protein n=1 Tax=unclassified Streptomyces TaxID=2593676 RepID=UPI002258A389|nr:MULTISPECIES: hypothetical protein [unclassified Streptomyces]MCX4550661.1 hypothetical protein [Streptomyces sp. NBC_01500]WSC22102.1 hypothetical protein OIE60_21760 [Streptomyces sp. NBC_01766]WSV55950.1 hypothetical protein OG282_20855 [Streptomyces sp. NBC_01014]